MNKFINFCKKVGKSIVWFLKLVGSWIVGVLFILMMILVRLSTIVLDTILAFGSLAVYGYRGVRIYYKFTARNE